VVGAQTVGHEAVCSTDRGGGGDAVTRYVFDGRALLRETPQRYHVVTHDLAARVAETLDVDRVELKGLAERLEERDPDAVATLATAADAEPIGWLDVAVDAPDEDVVDAAVRLLSESVTRFVLRSGGEAVYGRYDDGQVYCALPEHAEPPVPDDLRDHLHRVERDVEDVAGGEITGGVLMALMEETPDEEDDGCEDEPDTHGGDGA
jgi:hypothetical protein